MLPDAGANAALAPAPLPPGAAHLHVAGYALLHPGSRPAALALLAAARAAGVPVSVDPSSAAPLARAPRVPRVGLAARPCSCPTAPRRRCSPARTTPRPRRARSPRTRARSSSSSARRARCGRTATRSCARPRRAWTARRLHGRGRRVRRRAARRAAGAGAAGGGARRGLRAGRGGRRAPRARADAYGFSVRLSRKPLHAVSSAAMNAQPKPTDAEHGEDDERDRRDAEAAGDQHEVVGAVRPRLPGEAATAARLEIGHVAEGYPHPPARVDPAPAIGWDPARCPSTTPSAARSARTRSQASAATRAPAPPRHPRARRRVVGGGGRTAPRSRWPACRVRRCRRAAAAAAAAARRSPSRGRSRSAAARGSAAAASAASGCLFALVFAAVLVAGPVIALVAFIGDTADTIDDVRTGSSARRTTSPHHRTDRGDRAAADGHRRAAR